MPPIRMIRLIMRAPLRHFAAPCCLFALSALATSLFAQQPAGKGMSRPGQAPPATTKSGPAPKPGTVTQTAAQANISETPKQPRPDANPMVIEPLSPELKSILVEWEQKSGAIKSLHGKHTRSVFNHTWALEKRSTGEFYVETPDKGRIDLVGRPPKKDVSMKISKQSGKPYELTADSSEMWICSGQEIIMVNGDEKTYEIAPVPKHLRGTNIIDGPLPFLFGMKADKAHERFQITLVGKNQLVMFLRIVPRRKSDKDNYEMAEIKLDRKSYLPIAVKLHDPTGNLETLYEFEILDMNKSSLRAKLAVVFGDSDPFQPDLRKKGYKLVLPSQEEGTARPPAPGAKGTNGTAAPRSAAAGPSSNGGQQAPRQNNPAPTGRAK